MNRVSIPPCCQREPSRGSAVWGNPSYYRRLRRRMYCRGRQRGATMVSNMQHASRSASRSEPRRKCLFLAMIPILTWSCARLFHRGEFGGGWIKCRARACSARVLAAAALVVLGVGALGSTVEGQESGGGVPEAPLPASVPSTDPTPVLSVAVSSAATSVVSGLFVVEIEFARPVSGFELGGISVTNGSAANLTGSGADYRAVITPAADGTVVVRVLADAALDDAGSSNLRSALFTRTAASRGSASSSVAVGPGIDTWDRSTVLSASREEFDRAEPDAGYTGNVDECVAGTTSQEFRDSILQRINWYRRMAGMDDVSERADYTADAQSAALIMAAEGELSHQPPSSWACYTAQGARGAGKSNLHYRSEYLRKSYEGVNAIDSYMRDSGDNNNAVGHRRWIIQPELHQMGLGKAYSPSASTDALYVLDSGMFGRSFDVREVRGFVAWPPSGYLPAEAVWGRWSFTSLGSSDISGATVDVVGDSGPIPVEIIDRESYRGLPSPAIVWAMDGDTDSSPIPEPADGDQCYTITVSGVRIARVLQDPYEYMTCILDLSVESTDLTGLFAPQLLVAGSVTHDSVALSWDLVTQPRGVTVYHYIVERLDGADWVEVRRSPAPLTRHTEEGLSPSTEYHFRVRLDTTNGDVFDALTTTTIAAPTEIDVRIVARRRPSGRIEFAVQRRTDGQWGERLLPAQRFFPTGTQVGRWLASTPVPAVGNALPSELEVRIAARRLSSSQIEFALQQRSPGGAWGERVLPARRFFPTGTQAGRWLWSTPITVAVGGGN